MELSWFPRPVVRQHEVTCSSSCLSLSLSLFLRHSPLGFSNICCYQALIVFNSVNEDQKSKESNSVVTSLLKFLNYFVFITCLPSPALNVKLNLCFSAIWVVTLWLSFSLSLSLSLTRLVNTIRRWEKTDQHSQSPPLQSNLDIVQDQISHTSPFTLLCLSFISEDLHYSNCL